uniref:Putative GT2: distantly related to flagellin b-O-N-acetylglucaminyltransferase n=1 Tax=Magnetococcus massalia (strain MO-1) TaxID=451514 RepID=A0A1S7LLV3_MAGMO|nr:putative GT2 : distantly related to flagellin b-O-N-acetylglucaminyltransferase [Candidatus Magnetococcus massalia]
MISHCPAGLSVIMIGQNEAHILCQTLPPLQKLADEIIYVDTGSTDESCAIAQAHGAKLFHHTWQHNFSLAKNQAIEQARFRWLLSVDCDEELVLDAVAKPLVAEIIEDTEHPAFKLTIDNIGSNGQLAQRMEAYRLFQNSPKIRFHNPVHESIGDSLMTHWPTFKVPSRRLRLLHHGYSDGERNRHKIVRNLDLLSRWVEHHPNNPYALYKLGSNLHHLGRTREGLAYLERSVHILMQDPKRGTHAYYLELLSSYADCLNRCGRTQEAAHLQQQLDNLSGQ